MHRRGVAVMGDDDGSTDRELEGYRHFPAAYHDRGEPESSTGLIPNRQCPPARAVRTSLADRHPYGQKPVRGSAERRVSGAQ